MAKNIGIASSSEGKRIGTLTGVKVEVPCLGVAGAVRCEVLGCHGDEC